MIHPSVDVNYKLRIISQGFDDVFDQPFPSLVIILDILCLLSDGHCKIPLILVTSTLHLQPFQLVGMTEPGTGLERSARLALLLFISSMTHPLGILHPTHTLPSSLPQQ